MKLILSSFPFLLACALLSVLPVGAGSPPVRVVIAGLVHGHVEGFLSNSIHRPEIKIIGVHDPDRSLFAR